MWLYSWGYYPRYGRFVALFLLYFVILGGTSLAVFIRAVRRLPESRERRRLAQFAFAYAAGFVGVINFLPAYGITVVPFGHLAALATLILIGRSIRKHQLFDITPAFAAENIVSTLSDPLIVTDDEGWIRIVNDAACELTGYARAELVGAPVQRLLDIVAAGDRELRPRTGKSIPVSVAISTLYEDDRSAGSVIIARDLRERLRIEAELHRQELLLQLEEVRRKAELRAQQSLAASAQEWRDTFDAIQMPLVILDAKGLVQRANRAALEHSCIGDDVLGCPVRELGSHTLWSEIDRLAQLGGSTRTQFEDASGATWDLALDVIGAEGQMVVAARDISAIVQLQQSLRRSETMSVLGALVGGVAHEVRNPLFAMSSTLEVFSDVYGAREEYRQFATTMGTQVSRVSNLMSDLLEFGRPAPTAFTPHPVREVVGEAIALCGKTPAQAK
ncbi:MAG TPA: PAS domain S-box protein [Thermoanaerobaculia bacterium]